MNAGSSTTSGVQSARETSASEEDVYEFRSTPKDTSTDEKGSDKSSDEKSDERPKGRTASDAEGSDDVAMGDEDSRRKRRTLDAAGKDPKSTGRVSLQRPERTPKATASGSTSKSSTLVVKTATAVERKSPSCSPKPPAPKVAETDAEIEDLIQKVPPLKIVISSRDGAGPDPETSSARSLKNPTVRSHAGLPYVITSSNTNDPADKEGGSSRCASPSGSAKSVDKLSAEEQRQQRVLRSTHRGGQSVERGSNNSSPVPSSSSPSPSPAPGESAECSEPGGAPSVSVDVAVSATKETTQSTDMHPRKRKIRSSRDENQASQNVNVGASTSASSSAPNVARSTDGESDPQPPAAPAAPRIYNSVQMYLDLRKEIERRFLQSTAVRPDPPRDFENYLIIKKNYVLASNTPARPVIVYPADLPAAMRDLFAEQETERYKKKLNIIVEKEKLVIKIEQEILRVHQRAAQMVANQPEQFSVVAFLRDVEKYNMPPAPNAEVEAKRTRLLGRTFRSWLREVDEQWDKSKNDLLNRLRNEADAMHAVQRFDWGNRLGIEYSACDPNHVPAVIVTEDFYSLLDQGSG